MPRAKLRRARRRKRKLRAAKPSPFAGRAVLRSANAESAGHEPDLSDFVFKEQKAAPSRRRRRENGSGKAGWGQAPHPWKPRPGRPGRKPRGKRVEGNIANPPPLCQHPNANFLEKFSLRQRQHHNPLKTNRLNTKTRQHARREGHRKELLLADMEAVIRQHARREGHRKPIQKERRRKASWRAHPREERGAGSRQLPKQPETHANATATGASANATHANATHANATGENATATGNRRQRLG
jgi:hypothetical protein